MTGKRTTVVPSWVAGPCVTRTDTRIGKPFVQSTGCPSKPSAQSAASTSGGNGLVKEAVGPAPRSKAGSGAVTPAAASMAPASSYEIGQT